MLGHLKDPIQFVLKRRLTRSRQGILTRRESNFVCLHHEYVYTSAPDGAKCANLIITSARRGDRVSPSGEPSGYLRPGVLAVNPPTTRYLQQNRWLNGFERPITNVACL
jgi:hypothetical protein